MQAEIGSAATIYGVNGIGFESGNEAFTEGRSLPWLQDVDTADVWTAWGIEYRDVLVLDADNETLEVFNLTERDLSLAENYEALRDILAP